MGTVLIILLYSFLAGPTDVLRLVPSHERSFRFFEFLPGFPEQSHYVKQASGLNKHWAAPTPTSTEFPPRGSGTPGVFRIRSTSEGIERQKSY